MEDKLSEQHYTGVKVRWAKRWRRIIKKTLKANTWKTMKVVRVCMLCVFTGVHNKALPANNLMSEQDSLHLWVFVVHTAFITHSLQHDTHGVKITKYNLQQTSTILWFYSSLKNFECEKVKVCADNISKTINVLCSGYMVWRKKGLKTCAWKHLDEEILAEIAKVANLHIISWVNNTRDMTGFLSEPS